MREMFSKRWFRWLIGLLAVVASVLMGRYQRMTGPTYPVPVDEQLAGARIHGELIRTHGGAGDAHVTLTVESTTAEGEVVWRRYPTDDDWSILPMQREAGELAADLPHQIPAAKLEYSVRLTDDGQELVLPQDETAVIRFRDDVPAWVCEQCGEPLYEEETVEAIQQVLQGLDARLQEAAPVSGLLHSRH